MLKKSVDVVGSLHAVSPKKISSGSVQRLDLQSATPASVVSPQTAPVNLGSKSSHFSCLIPDGRQWKMAVAYLGSRKGEKKGKAGGQWGGKGEGRGARGKIRGGKAWLPVSLPCYHTVAQQVIHAKIKNLSQGGYDPMAPKYALKDDLLFTQLCLCVKSERVLDWILCYKAFKRA